MKLFFLRALLAASLCLPVWPALAAFTDNGDGTVTDTVTGLMWDKCSWGLSGNDCSAGDFFTGGWTDALGAAVTANNANYKGYNDWRLPNINELESLVDITATSNPTIDTTAFPNTSTDSFNFYWSSTTLQSNPSSAWTVRFNVGTVVSDGKTFPDYVRLVRGGPGAAPFDLLAGPVSDHSIVTAADPVAGGSVSCDPNPVGDGANSACTATPGAGYQFSHWTGDCSGSGACTLTGVTSGKSVTAHFNLITYAIGAVASPLAGGSVSCDPNPVDHGANSTCTATPNAGYQFTQWSGDCSGGGACVLTNVTSSRSVTAQFTLTDGGGNGGTGGNGDGSGGSATPIPTLSQWATALLAAILGMLALWGMRAARKH